jgi:hypothetical protein
VPSPGTQYHAKAIQNAAPANVQVQYSDIEGLLGATNIQQDPLFSSLATGRLRLQSGSPCINIGNSTLLPSDVLDINQNSITTEVLPLDIQGVRRISPVGTILLDMGAYEYQ